MTLLAVPQHEIVDEIIQCLARGGIADPHGEAQRIVTVTRALRDPDGAKEATVAARRRAAGMPLAYALGAEAFMGHEFHAEPGVIIPREVSGHVVRAALRLTRTDSAPALQVVDMCSGSGNLACVLAMELPGARVWSADLVPACSDLARRNVARHGLADRVDVVTGDLFAPLAGAELTGRVDVITAAPPFISTGRLAKDRAHLLEHEPREAFDAGPYGLAIHRRLVKEALPFLRPGGWLVCEAGEGQANQVRALFERAEAYDDIHLSENEAGVPVVVSGRRRTPRVEASA